MTNKINKIGIIREGKIPVEKRVPLSPIQCAQLLLEYPGLDVLVQPSTFRCFKDDEYRSHGIKIAEDLSECDLILGIKEVPVSMLIEKANYMFFSHTIKKQPHNRSMIKAIVANKITLIDYECLTDKYKNRVIGFGRFAGIIGAYNGVLSYGKKYDLFELKPAYLCKDKSELEDEMKKARLPNVKILVTGGGRVANGATETMGTLKIRKVTPYEFLNCSYREPVYCQLHSKDYNLSNEGNSWNSNEFYTHPEKYKSMFLPYTKVCDLLLVCHYWNPGAPVLFSKEDMKAPDFRISVIADVTCDINGSVPSTMRPATIEQPFYGYNPLSESEDDPFSNESITVMAVDNLPCELPRDSSEDFGKELIERVFPALMDKDPQSLIERATIINEGTLNPDFNFLSGYISE